MKFTLKKEEEEENSWGVILAEIALHAKLL